MIDFVKRMIGLKKSDNGALSKFENVPKSQRQFILVDEVKTAMEDMYLYNCGYIKKKNVEGFQMMSLNLKKTPRA